MIQSLTSGHRDKKLLAEAQQMLGDSRNKIEYLRMRILKVKQSRQHQQDTSSNGDLTNKGSRPVVIHRKSNRSIVIRI